MSADLLLLTRSVGVAYPSMSRVPGDSKLVIFDWDDTLFPTSYLNELKYIQNNMLTEHVSDTPQDLMKKLTDYETTCVETLDLAWKLSGGNIVIVTNGDVGWVSKSGDLFLRKVCNWLRKHCIQVVSARSLYENEFPDEIEKWKTAAFMVLCKERFRNNSSFNLLSVGDSDYEEIATRHVCTVAPNAICKSTKMVEHPTLEQLSHQHYALQKQLDVMITSQQPELFTFALSDEYKRWCDENGQQY